MSNSFIEVMQNAYSADQAIVLGAAMLEGEVVVDAPVSVPLKMMNRHGLIAGATGTGKTKTLQVLAEQLSENGVPVLLMDLKGDLSGLAAASPGHQKITERHQAIGFAHVPQAYPVELFSLTGEEGTQLRATTTEFGPVLLSRILDLTPTQSGILAMVFQYCDEKEMPLVDLKDLKQVLNYATGEGKAQFSEQYGRVSTSSTGAILRKIISLEQQGADAFFGEPSLDVDDLMQQRDGRGVINIVRLTDIQDKPALFSTFMLSLLAEIYETMPEQGDADQPELVIFIDEAHLVFKQASKALLDQIESMVKLIRSKGIGLYFVTQNPSDIPDAVLSQLGLKIQHALRAFTAKDRKAIRLSAQNYPESEFYDTEQLLTTLGIGEALVTALDRKGRPTALAATMLRAPNSRMDVLTETEKNKVMASALNDKYATAVDRQSAYEILKAKIQKAKQQEPEKKSTRKTSSRQNPIVKVLTSATFIRGMLSVLKKVMR